jgi:hypothetical protein
MLTMDTNRFDAFTRILSGRPSRRGTVAALGGALLSLLPLGAVNEGAAKRGGKGKGKKKKKKGTPTSPPPPPPPPPGPPTCSDGARNGNETDVDCGGGTCPKCAIGKDCQQARDCASGVCQNGRCASRNATCNDGIKNGGETAIDCGGPDCPPCGNGKACSFGFDCQSGRCSSGLCAICTSFQDCGSDIHGTCLCAINAGTCVSDLPQNQAPFRDDCNCGPGLVCVQFDAGNRCLPVCGSSEICGVADHCKGNFATCGYGRCFQPLGGGPTRCGNSFTGFCGCGSDQECQALHGAGTFCVTFDPQLGCNCGPGVTTFCARSQ